MDDFDIQIQCEEFEEDVYIVIERKSYWFFIKNML